MQTTLLSLAIAMILALLAALIGPHFVDWNAHRASFEQQASQLLGLPVRVAGNMDVRLLPSPILLLGDIEIGRADDPQALRAGRLGIEFALPPLLSGKLRAVEMVVGAPRLRLALDRDGRATVPPALAGLNVEALSIDRLTVEDAQIELADAASGRRAMLGKLWFSGEVKGLPGPFRGEGAFVLDGGLYGYRITSARPEGGGARIKFSLDPSDRPLSAEADGLLTLADGVPRFEGSAAIAQRAGKGADAAFWRIAARLQAHPAAALFEQIDIQIGPEERALKLTGTAEARFGERPRLDAVLSARTLDADRMLARDGVATSPRQAVGALLSATADIATLPIPVQLGFSVDSVTLGGGKVQTLRGDIELNSGSATLASLELRAPGFAQLQASGRLHGGRGAAAFEGPIEISAIDPRAFVEWLEGKPAASTMPARPLRLRGDLRADATAVALRRLHADFDGRTIRGDVSYARAGAAGGARLQAKLQAEDLDLDTLLPVFGPAQAWIVEQRPESLSLSLVLGRLRFSGTEAEKVDLQLALDRDVLVLDRIAVGDYGGLTLNGKGRVDLQAPGPRGAIAFDLDLRQGKGLATLLERFAPDKSTRLTRLAAAASPGRMSATLAIEAAGRAAPGRATLSLAGALGPIRLDLTSAMEGDWSDPASAQLKLRAALEADDVNTFVRWAGADNRLALPAQRGSLTLSAHGKAAGELMVEGALAAPGVDARVRGSARLSGPADRSAALNIAVENTQIAFAAAAAVAVTLRARAQVDASGVTLEKLDGSVAGAALGGRLHIGTGQPLVVEGQLQSDALDLPMLLPALGLAAAGSGSGWSEAPFATAGLPPLAGSLDLTVRRLHLLPALQAGQLRTHVSFNGSEISASGLEAELAEGRVRGRLSLRHGMDGLSVQGHLTVDNADAAKLLAAGASGAFGGRVSLDLNFEGAGLSPRALIGSLNGGGGMTLSPLRVSTLDPRAFAAAMRAVDQGLPLDVTRIRDVVVRALETGSLSVAKAKGSIGLAAGVARIESFEARAEGADLTMSGSYNVPQSALDLRLQLLGPATGSMALRPELSVLLRGPAAAPQRTVDVAALTGWLALRSVEEQTRRIEAIERGRPADPPKSEEKEKRSAVPEPSVALPRRRPPPTVQTQPSSLPAPPRTELKPLPPPIDIKPLPGEPRRVIPRIDNMPLHVPD